MRRLFAGAALCTLAGSAGAADVFFHDAATGLVWYDLARIDHSTYDYYQNLPSGERLATAYEVRTFFTDLGLQPPSGTFVQPGTPGPSIPAGLFNLLNSWGRFVGNTQGEGNSVSFITSTDTLMAGFVGTGFVYARYSGGNNYEYGSGASALPVSFDQLPGYMYGAAIVSGADPVYAIPEPTTYALLALGLITVWLRRGRSARR